MTAAARAAGVAPIHIMMLVVRVAGITIVIMDTRVTMAGIMVVISAEEGITKIGAMRGLVGVWEMVAVDANW